MTDDAPKRLDGACGGAAQQAFELGEDLLDRVEVGAVGRQVEHSGASGGDRLAHARHLVGGEIVHHHEIACTQDRHQRLLDVGEEPRAVDRAIEHAGRAQPS
jgi:hypothetical protein